MASSSILPLSDLRLRVLVEPYTIQLLAFPAGFTVPADTVEQPADFFSVTYTKQEVSILADERHSKALLQQDGVREKLSEEPSEWRAFKIAGPLDLSLVGIMYHFTGPLKEAKLSMFASSTFLTDYILVKASELAAATRALREAGWTVVDPSG